jgi:hypothetical protein
MGTRSAAEIVDLSSNIFCYCHSPGNKYKTDRILNHLILAGSKTLWLPYSFEPLKGSPKDKVQDNK